jgi:hypothetical protein
MQNRQLHVTIRLDHELSGIRAEAILRDGDRAPVVGVGQVVRQRMDPFPAREDLAVVDALRNLADALVVEGERAHPCAPGDDEDARAAAPADGARHLPRQPTVRTPRDGRARAGSRASRPATSRVRR